MYTVKCESLTSPKSQNNQIYKYKHVLQKKYKIQDQNCCKNVTNKNVIVEKGEEEEEEGKE